MSGAFEGLSELEWLLFADLFPPSAEPMGKGRPPLAPRPVINSLLYVLITGCRWCDLPRGDIWAPKSTAHRRLGEWFQDGTLAQLKARMLGLAQEKGLIQWEYGAVDGAFSPWEGRGEGSGKRTQGQRSAYSLSHRGQRNASDSSHDRRQRQRASASRAAPRSRPGAKQESGKTQKESAGGGRRQRIRQ